MCYLIRSYLRNDIVLDVFHIIFMDNILYFKYIEIFAILKIFFLHHHVFAQSATTSCPLYPKILRPSEKSIFIGETVARKRVGDERKPPFRYGNTIRENSIIFL